MLTQEENRINKLKVQIVPYQTNYNILACNVHNLFNKV